MHVCRWFLSLSAGLANLNIGQNFWGNPFWTFGRKVLRETINCFQRFQFTLQIYADLELTLFLSIQRQFYFFPLVVRAPGHAVWHSCHIGLVQVYLSVLEVRPIWVWSGLMYNVPESSVWLDNRRDEWIKHEPIKTND